MTQAKLTCDRCKAVISEYTMYDENHIRWSTLQIRYKGGQYDHCETCAALIWDRLTQMDEPEYEDRDE